MPFYRMDDRSLGPRRRNSRRASDSIPLLVSPYLEGHSGAMFGRKGFAILPPPELTDSHLKAFIAASEAWVSRANVRVAS